VPLALARSLSIVRKFKPDVVLGVGGYASGPMVLAAALAGYPTAIQETEQRPRLHQPHPGPLRRARCFIAFEAARPFFPARKVALVGNPVRRKFVESAPGGRAAGGLGAGGGRQPGARAGERSGDRGGRAAGAEARCRRRSTRPAPPTPIAASSATAPWAWPSASRCALHRGHGRRAGAAALVVGRAGALTLAELAIVGKPAILIPLPTAADDHQSKNAAAFAPPAPPWWWTGAGHARPLALRHLVAHGRSSRRAACPRR
jgi:UDP-N-acetylglucosamine--N-acetylmuramyl-(pentapeptide) pyrophosphoryl-undecaprenol N-acetylglucosamine transferase